MARRNLISALVVVFLVLPMAASSFACGELLGVDPPPEQPPTDAGGAGDTATSAADTSTPAVDAGIDVQSGCPTSKEVVQVEVDAVLDATNLHMDQSDVKVCNLDPPYYCALQFRRVASTDKQIVAITLKVPRATSTDCDGPCDSGTFHESGTILVRHMTNDFNEEATWNQPWPNVTNAGWYGSGALGTKDSTTTIASVLVGESADAQIAIDPKTLSNEFKPTTTLSFHLRAQDPFQFVVQRKKGGLPSSPRPTLEITYCQ